MVDDYPAPVGWDAFADKTGFTGEKKDALGRRVCYQSGKRVTCAPGEQPHESKAGGGMEPAPATDEKARDVLKDAGSFANANDAWQAMRQATADMTPAQTHALARSVGLDVPEGEAGMALRDHAADLYERLSGSVQNVPMPVVKDKPYKSSEAERSRLLAEAGPSDVVTLDPKALTATQPHVYGDVLDTFKGKLQADKPALVVEYEGKHYIEEGHHRAVYALESNQQVPAVVARVGKDGRLELVRGK